MAEALNGENELKLSEDLEAPEEIFIPSDKEKSVVAETFLRFRETADSRNQNFEFFDGLNLIDYIEDSVRRFITNVDERESVEDWQAVVHDQFTRNKVLAILGKVMQVLPVAEFHGRGDEDCRKASILTSLYEYVEEIDDYEEFMTHALLEAIVKGTSVCYEGVDYQTKKVRDVKGVNDNITVTENTITTTRLRASIVPLEEFYPSSVSVRKIKDMPFCFWRKVIPFSTFQQDWGMFAKSKWVEGKRTFSDDELRPFYADYISADINVGDVEVILFYDEKNDQYVIIANGVWLNPLGGEEISPLPFNHKELPFFDIKFDFLGDWFYGKSLPDRLKTMQDVLNVLTNMLLDQSFLTVFPPILTNGFDSIEDDYLRPGRRTPIDTQGLPIDQAFHELKLSTPSGWHQYILEYTRKIMEESSLDRVSQGIAGAGDRTTAQEVRIAADGVSSILQLFARMVNYGVRRKAVLKAKNILQFGFDPKAPMVRQVLGEGAQKDVEEAFNIFKINNAVLSGGKRGVKIIEIYGDKQKLPTKANLKARSMLAKKETKQDVEIIAITPDYIREFEFDVKIIPNAKAQSSKELEKALQLEKVRVYLTFFPNIVDINELAAETAEKMGDDPTKILKSDIFQPAMDPRSEAAKGMSANPQDATANNMLKSAGAGNQGMAEMAALSGAMTG